MAVDVFDDDGRAGPRPGRRAGVHEAVAGHDARALKDPERYLETYWSRWPDVWVHGDWASIVEDGQWYLHGRSDDTIKIAGKRLGPAEVESVLVSHPAVVEAAAVGVPDEVKGEALWAFVVLPRGCRPGTSDLAAELVDLVASRLGSSFRPSGVVFVSSCPRRGAAR